MRAEGDSLQPACSHTKGALMKATASSTQGCQSHLFTTTVLGCTISLPLFNMGYDMLGSYQPMFMITIPLVVATIAFLFICTSKIKKA